jgi:ATP-dependent RNA helicase DDX56/DBP9
MPQDPAGYVHQIGRTGRANKAGASISLISFIFNMIQPQRVA